MVHKISMIFTLKNNVPIITPEGLFVPEMRKIWESEKDKSMATKRMCYIYHMADPKSVYAKLSEDEKEATIIKDFFGDLKWKPSKDDLFAIDKYNKLTETVALRYLKATELAMDKIAKILQSTHVDMENMKDIISAVEKGEKLITSYSKLVEQVEREISANKKIRGGFKPNIFETD